VPEDPAHQELRAIKDAMVKAFNARDYPGFLRHLHPNVVATWQDSEVARHPEGVEAFMRKMSEGDTKVVERVQADLKVDELTSLYNDKNTGVAFGTVDQEFTFANGKQLQLTSRWTATFVKENGRWLVVAFHVSANVFNNPIIALAVKKTALWVGLGAAVVGLMAGWMLGRLRKVKAPSPA
jgi:ketosteroid isomerase-like protein